MSVHYNDLCLAVNVLFVERQILERRLAQTLVEQPVTFVVEAHVEQRLFVQEPLKGAGCHSDLVVFVLGQAEVRDRHDLVRPQQDKQNDLRVRVFPVQFELFCRVDVQFVLYLEVFGRDVGLRVPFKVLLDLDLHVLALALPGRKVKHQDK